MTPPPRPAPRPKQEEIPIMREVLQIMPKADDLEVHLCKARLDGVTVIDIRDYIPSLGVYGRGTTLPWNTGTLKLLKGGVAAAERETRG